MLNIVMNEKCYYFKRMFFIHLKFHGQRSLVGYTVHGVAKSWTNIESLPNRMDFFHTAKN